MPTVRGVTVGQLRRLLEGLPDEALVMGEGGKVLQVARLCKARPVEKDWPGADDEVEVWDEGETAPADAQTAVFLSDGWK